MPSYEDQYKLSELQKNYIGRIVMLRAHALEQQYWIYDEPVTEPYNACLKQPWTIVDIQISDKHQDSDIFAFYLFQNNRVEVFNYYPTSFGDDFIAIEYITPEERNYFPSRGKIFRKNKEIKHVY